MAAHLTLSGFQGLELRHIYNNKSLSEEEKSVQARRVIGHELLDYTMRRRTTSDAAIDACMAELAEAQRLSAQRAEQLGLEDGPFILEEEEDWQEVEEDDYQGVLAGAEPVQGQPTIVNLILTDGTELMLNQPSLHFLNMRERLDAAVEEFAPNTVLRRFLTRADTSPFAVVRDYGIAINFRPAIAPVTLLGNAYAMYRLHMQRLGVELAATQHALRRRLGLLTPDGHSRAPDDCYFMSRLLHHTFGFKDLFLISKGFQHRLRRGSALTAAATNGCPYPNSSGVRALHRHLATLYDDCSTAEDLRQLHDAAPSVRENIATLRFNNIFTTWMQHNPAPHTEDYVDPAADYLDNLRIWQKLAFDGEDLRSLGRMLTVSNDLDGARTRGVEPHIPFWVFPVTMEKTLGLTRGLLSSPYLNLFKRMLTNDIAERWNERLLTRLPAIVVPVGSSRATRCTYHTVVRDAMEARYGRGMVGQFEALTHVRLGMR